MNLSEYTLMNLSKAVCGDSDGFIYLTGKNLIHYFNKFGYNETSLGCFSRNSFTEQKLRELNGKGVIRQIIEETVNPRRFLGHECNYDDAAKLLNEMIRYDKIELRKLGEEYKVFDLNELLVKPSTLVEINHGFVNEQIKKCNEKIVVQDYNGAITNARSMIEALFIEVIEKHEKIEIKNDGNLDGLWSKVKKILKLELDKENLPEYVIQILSGIDTAIKGLAGLSNNTSDRHATKFKTRKHHAKLAVNLAITLGEFLLDSWQFQKGKTCATLEHRA